MTFYVPSWPNINPSKLDFGNRYRNLHVINKLMILKQDYFSFSADLRFFIVVQTWCWCFSSTNDWYGTLRRSCWCVWYGSCCLWLRESHFYFKPTRSRCSESDSYCWLKSTSNNQNLDENLSLTYIGKIYKIKIVPIRTWSPCHELKTRWKFTLI